MKVLVIGPGVIGSVLAAHLSKAGMDVTLMARGRRLEELRRDGLKIRDGITGRTVKAMLSAIERPDPGQSFDLVLVTVRAEQVAPLLPFLQQEIVAPTIVIMSNNLALYDQIAETLGERALFGFPGLGGGQQGEEIVYRLAPAFFQRTTLAESNGEITPRLLSLVRVIERAGLPASAESDMRAWLRTHHSWVLPFAGGIYAAGGSNYLLAEQPELIKLMLQAIRECFQVMAKSGIRPTPPKFGTVTAIPASWQAKAMPLILRRKEIELLATLHCQNARGEMQELVLSQLDWIRQSGQPAVALTELYTRAGLLEGRQQ